MAPQSLRAAITYAGNVLSQLSFGLDLSSPFASTETRLAVPYVPLSGAPSCPISGPLSCHNNTPVTGNSCCFVHPGGRMLLTQFWDQDVHVGGSDEDWTIHGLWPDLCTGGYDSYCNITPRYNNITEILQVNGQDELLEFMNRYWVADRGTNAHLWTHEYNKHATCINTLAPACYSSREGKEKDRDNKERSPVNVGELAVVDYFTRATALFRTLDTYTALQQAGITPHGWKRYPLADVRGALERFVGGGKVVLRCQARDVLQGAWYYYYIKGSLQTGEFVPATDLGRDSGNCPPWVRYLPKRARSDL